MILGQSTNHIRKYKAPPPAARVEITVLRDSNGKPLMNAAVIVHPIEGDKDKGNMELKSNEDGIALLDQVIPIGSTVRLQVVASGYQTYGEDFKIDAAEKQIVVRLKRPSQQYSIYAKTPGATTSAPEKAPSGQPTPAANQPANPTTPVGTTPVKDSSQPKP
jgi:hypothetical protein